MSGEKLVGDSQRSASVMFVTISGQNLIKFNLYTLSNSKTFFIGKRLRQNMF